MFCVSRVLVVLKSALVKFFSFAILGMEVTSDKVTGGFRDRDRFADS